MCIRFCENLCKCSLSISLVAAAVTLQAQTGGVPVKAGLWETQVSSTMSMSIPPELEARIAAMPAEQQERVRSMMAGAKPTTTTTKSCVATQTSLDNFLDEAQQKNGLKCTFSNRTKTADGASFDTNCTTPQGTAKGHSEFHMTDDDHVTGTTHMTADMTSPSGSSTHLTLDSTLTAKYLGTDCGDVRPNSSGQQ